MLIKENKLSFQPFAAARLIDTHAHLNFSAYKDDADKVIRRSLDNDVWLINAGSQYSTSKRAVEIVERYEKGVYAAVGLHPIYASEQSEGLRREHGSLRIQDGFQYKKYKELAESKKVVAIGEIGLDYKSEYVAFKQEQKEVFLEQLDLARELDLPIIFHCRMAHQDLLKIIDSGLKGVIHCFTGTWAEAQKYIDMGFSLGFNGIIFRLNLDEIIKKTPLERILIETDCPFLTPSPKEGRNEPLYVKYVAEKIAKIKGLSYKEISRITTENARKLFKIKEEKL